MQKWTNLCAPWMIVKSKSQVWGCHHKDSTLFLIFFHAIHLRPILLPWSGDRTKFPNILHSRLPSFRRVRKYCRGCLEVCDLGKCTWAMSYIVLILSWHQELAWENHVHRSDSSLLSFEAFWVERQRLSDHIASLERTHNGRQHPSI